MGGKTTTIATEEPRLGNLRVQTSMYGLTVPWVRGQTQMVGNLVWFGNFQAIPITSSSSSGGKGGGGVRQVDTRYEYKAAAIMALGSGPVLGIPSVWKGKERYSGKVVAGRSQMLQHTVVVPTGGLVVAPLPGGASYGVHIAASQYQEPQYGGTS